MNNQNSSSALRNYSDFDYGQSVLGLSIHDILEMDRENEEKWSDGEEDKNEDEVAALEYNDSSDDYD